MDHLHYAASLMRHWKEHFPARYRVMKKDGTLELEANRRGAAIADQVATMERQGLTREQAEEWLRDEIYPRP